jgi:hypothetical protein
LGKNETKAARDYQSPDGCPLDFSASPNFPNCPKLETRRGTEGKPQTILASDRPEWSIEFFVLLDPNMAKVNQRKKTRRISKPAAGGLTGAVVGGLVGGPVGAVMGGLAGAVVGSAAEGKKPIKRAAIKLKAAGKRVGAKLSKTSTQATPPRPATKSSRKKAKAPSKSKKSGTAKGKKGSRGKTKSGKSGAKK